MIALATIAFNQPRLIAEQIRLLKKNLSDPHTLTVLDQSTSETAAKEIRATVLENVDHVYVRLATLMHHEGLNNAARLFQEEISIPPGSDAPYFGFLDHDVFPVCPTTLIDKIEGAGFYGVGQRHPATGHLYLWPGFCFFSREWLNGRSLDFTGYRDGDKRNDGDTGSAMWSLFADEDWRKLFRIPHSYKAIREPDGYGLQSFGYELLGDWMHLSNGSHWMKVPRPEERDKLLFDILAEL